jgi:hypothetical protein
MKKDAVWIWTDDQQAAMDILREKVTTALVLATLIFRDPRYGIIFLVTDACIEG